MSDTTHKHKLDLRLNDEIHQWISAQAKRKGLPKSTLIRMLLADHMQADSLLVKEDPAVFHNTIPDTDPDNGKAKAS